MVLVLEGTASNVGTATRTTLQVSFGYKDINLLRVKVHHVSGSANHFHPYIFSSSTGVINDPSQEFAGSQTSANGLFDSDGADNIPALTDVNGRLYLAYTPNTGSDNVFEYKIYYDPH